MALSMNRICPDRISYRVDVRKNAIRWQHACSNFWNNILISDVIGSIGAAVSNKNAAHTRHMNQDDFKHLRELANKRPKRKAKLIQMLWPEIRRALNAGHTVREIALALKKDGIEINYSNLRNYVAHLKRENIAETPEKDTCSAGVQIDSKSASHDAGSAIRAQRAKEIKFDHDPFSTRIKDLV